LSNGKAPGLDQVNAEFLKHGAPILAPLLVKLFNFILNSGCYPKEWAHAIICSIYKSGDKGDPANYRGISLLPSISKLFDTILDSRFRVWEKVNNVLDQNQAGFRANYSTIDHIFTLNSIIMRYRSKRQKVYCAFIDFCKAFDSVNRNVLYYKLSREGVSSKFIRLLKSMYSQTRACVKGLENELFDITAGVQQGAPLSPSFFAIILNDFDRELRSNNAGSVSIRGVKIHSLLFADDLVLLAESPDGLLHSLAVLNDYSKRWGLRLNAAKSNVLVFRNPGRFDDNTVWKLGRSDQVLQMVDQYKYLGVWFKTTGLTQFTLQKRAELGNRAKFSLFNSLKFFKFNPKLALRLFDTLVTSVLLYGAEAWGYLSINKHIELVHTSFLRHFLSVRKSTPLLALYGETGRVPLACIGTLRTIYYWAKLLSSPEDRYAKIAYNDAYELYQTKPAYSPWCSFIYSTLCQISMGGHFIHQSIPNPKEFYSMVRSRSFDNYRNAWKIEIENYRSLDSYIKFKPNHGLEEYLSVAIDKRHLTALTRLRLRSHNLAIETGRHESIEREQRLCVYCNAVEIEDEVHFLLFCKLYEELRRPLIPFISELNTNDAFVFLLHSTAPNIVRLVAKFIYLAFIERSKYNLARL
jgi:Reverse transcriptase (RNA-dependent DNA polymerase)